MHWRRTRAVGNLALVYLSSGHLEDALTFVDQHLVYAQLLSIEYEVIWAIGNRGMIDFPLSNTRMPVSILNRPSPTSSKMGGSKDYLYAAVNLSWCYAHLNRLGEARELAYDMRQLAEQHPTIPLHIITLRCTATYEPSAVAEKHLWQAYNLASKTMRRLDEAGCLFALASIAPKRSSANRLRKQAREILRQSSAIGWSYG